MNYIEFTYDLSFSYLRFPPTDSTLKQWFVMIQNEAQKILALIIVFGIIIYQTFCFLRRLVFFNRYEFTGMRYLIYF